MAVVSSHTLNGTDGTHAGGIAVSLTRIGDTDPLFVTKVSDPANGSVIINVDGTLTYTPDPNFNGMDSFTYVTEDGNGGSNTATVSVSVGDVNDARGDATWTTNVVTRRGRRTW